MWSDKVTFETGKRGRIWVTRQPEEKNCQTCIQSVYRSRRVSVMVWGAIGWDYKSPLIFLTRMEGKRGICSTAYLEQVLESVVFLYYDSLRGAEKRDFYLYKGWCKGA